MCAPTASLRVSIRILVVGGALPLNWGGEPGGGDGGTN